MFIAVGYKNYKNLSKLTSLVLIIIILSLLFFRHIKGYSYPQGSDNSQDHTDKSNINVDHYSSARDHIQLGDRHIFIVQQGNNYINLNYFFSIINNSSLPLPTKIDLLYPKNTYSINALEGVLDTDIKVDESSNQTFYIETIFPPKKSIIALNYQVKTSGFSSMTLQFNPVNTIKTLSFLVKKQSGLKITAVTYHDKFTQGVPEMLLDSNFNGIYSIDVLAKSSNLHIRIANLSANRFWFYVLGAILAMILVISSALSFKNTL